MLFKSLFKLFHMLFINTTLVIVRFFVRDYVKKPEISIGNAQDIGSRNKQEDSFTTIRNENGILGVLADGMGGLSSGKEASNLVTETFLEEFSMTYHLESINKFLINTTYISNNKVLEIAQGRNLGTTLVGTVIRGDLLYWISVGDSHIYLYRDNELYLLNEDHIYANKLKAAYKAGEISREEAFNHAKGDRLTSYLGYEDFHEIDYSVSPIELQKKDKIILCSDGIYKNLSEIELEESLAKKLHPMQTAELILEDVLEQEIINQDNATIIVLEKNK
ncbi:PP2C family protein-serine/threonine phosphatase [Orenia marismortui]|uniref:Serine/threonine protein phosphatase PrpC n=1 Tax=Orenia marismortui TaxID=46469 RepID=A0A4R8HPY0_9FIRM|nr:protein phosphatase 2C domain-containing protein [Orenia marismortui]TDX58981.1 serine/threonine protein phosphatase PrpC [Orenia marismortui]